MPQFSINKIIKFIKFNQHSIHLSAKNLSLLANPNLLLIMTDLLHYYIIILLNLKVVILKQCQIEPYGQLNAY